MLKGDIHGNTLLIRGWWLLWVPDHFGKRHPATTKKKISISMINPSQSDLDFFNVFCVPIICEFWMNLLGSVFYSQATSAISGRHSCRGFKTWVVAIFGQPRLFDVVSRIFELLGRSMGWTLNCGFSPQVRPLDVKTPSDVYFCTVCMRTQGEEVPHVDTDFHCWKCTCPFEREVVCH